ncbi:MAG: MG2 domain-containing protein [Myxococcaceae bacterium]
MRRALVVLAILAVVLIFISTRTCLSVGLSKGLWLDECPDGELRQTITVLAPELKRAAAGTVTVTVNATYLTAPNDLRHTESITRFTPTVALVSSSGETLLPPKSSWRNTGSSMQAEVELPKVNDGDYTLRAKVTSPIGDETLDLPLPLYTPARVHVLTDRPLYEAGNTVKFRALALKASDLTPLEERPGTWRVLDPNGEVLLEERAPSGPWGVVSGSFPLDRGAASGSWTVSWSSGGVTESRTFTVKPFTLPRFRVEASTVKPFYGRKDRPVLKGNVTYSSGAPVANAKVELSWNVSGEWPAPTKWTDGTGLPKLATTSKDGTFVVELPQVPDDLQGSATLSASMGAVDPSGDRVEGSASVLLSQDPISVTAVTELNEGLVEGYNNRLFLRATMADGRLLDDVTLHVKRLWEPTDKGTDAKVDEDGVASLQVDPGPAVTVVIPAMPFRPPPPTPWVTRNGLEERLGLGNTEEDEGSGEPSLADRMTFDKLDAKLEHCSRYVLQGNGFVQANLLVRASGSINALSVPQTRLGRCVEAVLKGTSFGSGKERFFVVSWNFDDSELPRFEVSLEGQPDVPGELELLVDDAMLDARDCLSATVKTGSLPRLMEWREQGREVKLEWAPIKGDAYADSALSCITSRVKSVSYPPLPPGSTEDSDPTVAPSIGFGRVNIIAPEKYESIKPQDTIMEGYEFLVTAKRGNENLGSTKLRMSPGTIPQIRLRATPSQLVRPGDTVKVEIVRGPDFTGSLPEKLFLTHAYESVEAKVDENSRTAEFKVPAGWQGWAGVEWGGGQVFLFVKPDSALTVKVTPEKPRYAPGQVAQLGIETKLGDRGGSAAVGLFGVDDSLSQLASLMGADELASLRPQASGTAAFGNLDAQALSLGRIRGANAAAATLIRVSSLPAPPQVEAAVSVQGSTVFDPNEAQVDRFYTVLGEFYAQVRAWETEAPAAEKMTPATMARLWSKSLDALEGKKEPVRDAWGRRLRLHRLPADLLALTEPRQVIVNGTRLPEDTQNWAQWVAKEKP